MAENVCRYCGEEFATRGEYERHMLVAHPAGGGTSLTRESDEASPDDLETGEASMVTDTEGTAAAESTEDQTTAGTTGGMTGTGRTGASGPTGAATGGTSGTDTDLEDVVNDPAVNASLSSQQGVEGDESGIAQPGDIGIVGEPTDVEEFATLGDTGHFGTVGDSGEIGDTEDVTDVEEVLDTDVVRPIGTPRTTNEAEGRGDIDVGDWIMGQNDATLSHNSRSELPTFRCSYCGAEFENHDELVEHIDSVHKRGELTA